MTSYIHITAQVSHTLPDGSVDSSARFPTSCVMCAMSVLIVSWRGIFSLKMEPRHKETAHHGAMVSYLFPLTTAHLQKYMDRECLVDVLVEDSDGEIDVITFDPLLLPSHCNDRFLPNLFLWAKDNNVLPLSAHGKWFGKKGESTSMDLLFPFYDWLRDYEDATNTFD